MKTVVGVELPSWQLPLPVVIMAGVGGDEKTTATARDSFVREAIVHLDHLYRVALYLGKDEDHAQDLVQETFARALAAYNQFRPGTNLNAWLTRVLYNLYFDYYHQRKRWISTEQSHEEGADFWQQLPAETPGPESQILSEELNARITEVLRKIPHEFQVPIVLVDMGDFSYEEAAAILSCPIGTIRSRLSRGRRLMRRHLQAYISATGVAKPK
jgi:RNA polymerase sigma-70 factor, ECF subfamily